MNKVLFLTPPFTQLNTPYPATAYLKGFLNTVGIASHQADLGIEVILRLFSSEGLGRMFADLEASDIALSDNGYRIYALRREYLRTIDPVIVFLQNKNPTLAHSICDRSYLPEAGRFAELDELDWAFGTMGIQDKARHLATLFLEDLGDLIQEAVDPHFGFSRYAERLGSTATHFQPLHESLQRPDTLISFLLTELLEEKVQRWQPTVVCLTVPFPGNLFGALKCGQYLKKVHPNVSVIMGGGYCNTELRSLREPLLFDYVDFVSLDDGEAPLLNLLEYLDGKIGRSQLKRVYARTDGQVVYYNNGKDKDIAQRDVGTPDYADLPLRDYLSVIEIMNPMHRLWSDGRWNKLTLAHGCYWGKCSFCDISLDYIKRYEPVTAALLCDRIEEIIAQTGQNGFHFVDEAAPPALMRDLALEIIRRQLTVTWWTNIRFEKSFTPDLCQLLKASGCIAVSGGLEVASDRLLERMKKGVTVAQVARVADAFTQAGIMVHAYLMYGFPTQTTQETIDSLEMVRQLFEAGVVQSGFWHRFAMTAHSPVGMHPAGFDVQRIGPDFGGFADNDLYHDDPTGAEHDRFADGLRKSLFNYMHGVGFELSLKKWFDFKVPPTSIPPGYIERSIGEVPQTEARTNAVVVWLGGIPELTIFEEKKGGLKEEVAELEFYSKKHTWTLLMNVSQARWLMEIMPALIPGKDEPMSWQQLKAKFETSGLGDFEGFLNSEEWREIKNNGLLVV
ncbi:B12-binding domain-containing radical SAM protein [Persicitalea jodogahamensis]|uniref:Radical SAM protein n=1 Tax=Persicitalea jodogahamensis TaxID=402147 RepID=A0A8J3D3N8_9BACT|nr:radical SAM protein [Persicitalea jodogahamensis]GHB65897.1 radical SAM protein [Persicitalea jodogahamensis]